MTTPHQSAASGAGHPTGRAPVSYRQALGETDLFADHTPVPQARHFR
jgi:hypothetical protein